MKNLIKYACAVCFILLNYCNGFAQNSCETDLNLAAASDNINGGSHLFIADNLTADIEITNNAVVDFRGLSSTLLNDGFKVEEGVAFSALNDCKTSTRGPELTDKISIAPNPTSGELQLTIEGELGLERYLSLQNMTGQELPQYRQNLRLYQGENLISLNLYDLPAGVYFLRLTDGQRSAVRKVIKE